MSLTGILRPVNANGWQWAWDALLWASLLLIVWIANGLLFDILKLFGLIGDPQTGKAASVYWPGMAMHASGMLAAVLLAKLTIAKPSSPATSPLAWYGYAAFIFALPYPAFRIVWAFGGTLGITNPGDAGKGFAPLLLAIPWLMAAALSLLLVSPPQWISRKLILFAGWTSTAIVASIAPAACWALVNGLSNTAQSDQVNIATWVFCLFYGSWLLYAISAGAATRAYQIRSSVKGECEGK